MKSNEWWLMATEAEIFSELRDTCNRLLPGKMVSTAELVELAYPLKIARGAGIERRQGLFRRLMRGGQVHMIGCFTRGGPIERYGREMRPYLWHASPPKCPACNGTGLASTNIQQEEA